MIILMAVIVEGTGLLGGAAQQLIQPDASIAWLSSSLLTAYIEGCSSARVNSGVMWLCVTATGRKDESRI